MKRRGSVCLVLVISFAGGCGGGNSSNVTLTVSPTSATVLLGASEQFTPTETGSSNAIAGSANGVANGNATVGTISSSGFHTAPETRPSAPILLDEYSDPGFTSFHAAYCAHRNPQL